MSLVEYGSSDEELDETLNEIVTTTGTSTAKEQTESKSDSLKLLFASLPKPKHSISGNNNDVNERCEVTDSGNSPLELSIVSEKKQKQPVKIFIPNINEFDEDEVPKKKQKSLQVSTGLVDMLPAPKNTTLGKTADKLVPYVLTKKTNKTPSVTTVAKTSKSTITLVNKNSSTALVDYDDKDSDEDGNETNSNNDFFSLKKCEAVIENTSNSQTLLNVDTVSMTPALAVTHDPYNAVTASVTSKLQILPTSFVGYDSVNNSSEKVTYSHNNSLEICQPVSINNNSFGITNKANEIKTESVSSQGTSSSNDEPLNFRPGWTSDATFSNTKPQRNCEEYNVVHPSQQRKNFVTKPELQEARSTAEIAKEIDITDERFLRLQGKKQRGKEDIQIIDISADQQLPGATNILMKNLTEELVYKPSRKKGEMPTTQQRRKHQITYLAFQAKERELELKNQWSSNRMTRRQTQAKYGF